MELRKIFRLIPELKSPEKKIGFNTKLKWTLITLVLFFFLINIQLFGLSENALEQFQYLATVLGTDFGSIVSLGIGPIVMASIILQLLSGSGIINIDQSTHEGKKFFQGLQKLLTIFFIVFEAIVYVAMQGLQPSPDLGSFGPFIMVIQLILGGLGIYYMTEIVQKWGFGSGVGLFIAGGVSLSIFTQAFQFLNAEGKIAAEGKVLEIFSAIQSAEPGSQITLFAALASIVATIVIFLIVVWAQSLKVEVPLSYGRIRGYSVKWPLAFFYASVIPVILTSALMANVQLFGGMIDNAAAPCLQSAGEAVNSTVNATASGASEACSGSAKIASYFNFLGSFSEGKPVSGLAFWLSSSNILELSIRGALQLKHFFQAITHMIFFAIFAMIFSIFWVKTSGLDAKSQAKKISSSGLQVAGFRQDIRILESILSRYVMPLTVMGGLSIGVLAALTDLLGALVSGTAMLLVIMIVFQFYQSIAQQHAEDMNPAMRKFMGG